MQEEAGLWVLLAHQSQSGFLCAADGRLQLA